MALIGDWLEALRMPDAASLAKVISALPGRPVYPGAHADRTLASAEWSIRAVDGRAVDCARMAYSIDPERAPLGAVAAFLAGHTPSTSELRALLAALEGVHVQIGVAASHAKLYVYSRGAPEGTLARVLDTAHARADTRAHILRVAGVAPAFAALDLGERHVAAKLYFEFDDAVRAAKMLVELGHDRLATQAAETAPAWGTAPARLVVSVRLDSTGERDVTLHVKMDRRPDIDAALAPGVRETLAQLRAEGRRLGWVLHPTYVSDLDEQGSASVQTLYYRLVSEAQ